MRSILIMLLLPATRSGLSNGFSANAWTSTEVPSLLNADGTVSIVLIGIDQQADQSGCQESMATMHLSCWWKYLHPATRRQPVPSPPVPRPRVPACPVSPRRTPLDPLPHSQFPPPHSQVHTYTHLETSSRDSPSGLSFIIPGSLKPGTNRDTIPLPITRRALDFTIPARYQSFETISRR